MENLYLIVGFLTVILFNTLGFLINRNQLFPQRPVNALDKRPRIVLTAVVVFFQFFGVALVSIGLRLKLEIAKTPVEALGFLKDALIFVVPVLFF